MWVEINMRHMEEAPSTLLRYTFEKGQHVSKGVLSKFKLGLIFINLTLTASSPLILSCLSTNPLLIMWLTPRVLHNTSGSRGGGGGARQRLEVRANRVSQTLTATLL